MGSYNNKKFQWHEKKSIRKVSILFVILLTIVFSANLRVKNFRLLEGEYLVTPDAYRYFRQARLIIEQGGLPHVDLQRNFPDGVDYTSRNTFLPRILALSYQIVHKVFPSVTLHEVASLYPPIVTSLALIFFFLFTNLLFGNFTALLALMMLSGLPIFIRRTMAGYADTDAAILLTFFAGLYFYTHSLYARKTYRQLFFAFIAGIIMGVLGLVWMGSGIIFLMFCLLNLLISWQRKYTKTDFYRFSLWLLPILVFVLGFTKVYRGYSQKASTILALYVPVVTWCVSLLILLVQRSAQFEEFSQRFHLSIGLTVSILLLLTVGFAFTVYSRGFSWIAFFIERLRYPFGKNKVMEFVGELKPTNLGNWRIGYGIIFFTTLAGFCLLQYRFSYRNYRLFVVHSIFGVLGICAIALQGAIPEFELFGIVSSRTGLIFLGNICLLTSIASTTRFRTSIASSDNNGEPYLFLTAWFLITLNLASSAVRFLLFFAPVSVILTCYFFNWMFQKFAPSFLHFYEKIFLLLSFFVWQVLINGSDILSFVIKIITAGKITITFPEQIQLLLTLFVTALLLGFILQRVIFQNKIQTNKLRVLGILLTCLLTWCCLTGLYNLRTVQRAVVWELRKRPFPNTVMRKSFKWLKENVPKNAVVAADWGIGSTITELGRRATIVDEEQNIPRILVMAKNFFCALNEKTALQFLHKYRVTHILLSSEDIAALNIYAYMASKSPDYAYALKLKPASEYHFQEWRFSPGKRSFAEDIQVGSIHLKRRDYRIISISLPYSFKSHPVAKAPPKLMIRAGDRQHEFQAKEVIIGEQSWYFPEGQLNGTLLCLGGVRDRTYRNHLTLYLSEEGREWFATKLFLGEHSDHFKLIYKSDPADKLYVKIWKIHY